MAFIVVILTTILIAKSRVLGSDPSVVLTTSGGTFNIQHSPSQMGIASTAEAIQIPGSDLDTGTTSILDRYSCTDYSATFAVEDPVNSPKTVTMDISLTGAVTKDDKPVCTIYWGDGLDDEVDLSDDPDSPVHDYAEFGVYVVTMDCTDDTLPPDTSITCYDHVSTCVTTSEFFDSNYKSLSTPLIFFASDIIALKSYMELTPGCGPDAPVIIWRITRVNVTVFSAFTSFEQPETSVLRLETLDPGEYIVYLEVTFPHLGDAYWATDFIVIKVILPELITSIYGGDSLVVPHGGIITVDATKSRDPVGNLSSVTDSLVVTWSFALYASTPFGYTSFMKKFPSNVLPAGSTIYQIQAGTDFLLEVDTSSISVNSVALVMFSMSRGSRQSSIVQSITFIANAIPLYIDCIYNCNLARERKFNFDKVELDAALVDATDLTGYTFNWKLFVWFDLFNIWFAHSTSSLITGLNTRSLGLLKGAFTEGNTYKIGLTVTSPAHASTTVEIIRHVNYIPYGGTCVMNTLVGMAARDWFTVTCAGWKGSDDRYVRNGAADINPILSYIIRQKTEGAIVPDESILDTRSQRSFLIVKVGDYVNAYLSTITIRITDMYKNYREHVLSLTANPAIDWVNVNASDYGASLVKAYTAVDYTFDEKQLRDMGKVEMIIPLVSSVCSHFHLIDLPVWEPPVPRVLNANGSILDLNPSGNTDLGSLADAQESTETPPLDPATLAIQEAVQNMTSVIKGIVDEYIINGTRKNDKALTSMLTNAFTNLASKDNFVNLETQIDMIYLGDIVGLAALEPTNSSEDNAAQVEESAGELHFMSQAVVNTVVPNNLLQRRTVGNLLGGRMQLSNMLSVKGDSIDATASEMSPMERAYLYLDMQSNIAYDLAGVKATAKETAQMAIKMGKNIQDKLKVCNTCNNENSSKTNQVVKKNDAKIIQTELTKMNKSSFRLDGIQNAIGGENSDSTTTSVSAVEFTENVFMYDNDSISSFVTSNILHIDVTAMDAPVSLGYMTFEQSVPTPQPQLTTPTVDAEDASMFSLHKFIYQSKTDTVCLIIRPTDEAKVTVYYIFIKLTGPPSILEYDIKVKVDKDNSWQYCIVASKMRGHSGLVYLGVQIPKKAQDIDYWLTLVTVGCLAWDEHDTKWHTDKCNLTWFPDEDMISCSCKDLTDLTFGNSFFVAPNSIDFSSVFLKFSPLNQAAVMGAIGCIFIAYIVVIILVIPLDGRDVVKWGITPLRDNFFTDEQFYIIKVYTGLRRGAGTRSQIAFLLTGEAADTGPRELFDGVREEFSTGSVMSFFLATKKDLGRLMHLHIWHDNSGDGDFASWYLNQVVVYDIANDETYTFVAERWLSVENNVEAKLTAFNSKEPVEFESRFFSQSRDRLSESHMWVSIMYRPQTSTFTRVQRTSCALVYIFLTMIANAMYFNPENEYQSPPLLQVGPLRFSTQQMFISIICALITTPAVMLIIFLFKRTKRKPINIHEDNARTCCKGCPCASRSCCCGLFKCNRRGRMDNYEFQLKKRLLCYGVPEFKGVLYLHHRFIFLAWFLVVAGTVVPAFFIILYSMEWGKQKSEEWLTTFLMSLIESILLVDPVMVICISFLLACVLKTNKDDPSVDINLVVENYKRYRGHNDDTISYSKHVLQSIMDDYHSYKMIPRKVYPPLQGEGLSKAADRYQHQQGLSRMLRDILLNVFFMLIIFSICYSNRDDRSYRHYEEVVNQIVTPWKLPQFSQIKTPGDVFTWVNRSVFPSMFPEYDITGRKLHWTLREFTSGYNNFRLGPPRLRQLRTTEKTCKIPYIGRVKCYGEYGFFNEAETDYCIGWAEGECPLIASISRVSVPAWKFTSAFDIWGMPIPGLYNTYAGGGYIAEFSVNLNTSVNILNELFENTWLDRQTRAVMFEFTLYCAATNIFIHGMFIIEFPETGGAVTSYSIYPLRLYTHAGAMGMFTLVCEVIFVIYLIVLLVKICLRLYQQGTGYFKQFWQVYEMLMFAVGIAAIAMFCIRLGFTTLTIENFKKDNKLFVNFSHIVFWDQMLITFLSALVFMATIRILEVFASSKKINAIVKIFQNCGKDLFWYGMTFIYLFLGFCILGFLLFGSELLSYMNIYKCMGTLFIAMIGKSKFTEINETQPILAKIFFILYIMSIVFFVLTIFLAILGGSIDSVMQGTRQESEEDLIEFIMRRFKTLVVKPDAKIKTENSGERSLSGQVSQVPFAEYSTMENQTPPVSHKL